MCPEPLDYSERRGSEDYEGGGEGGGGTTVKMFDATELKTILCQAECSPRGFSSDDKHLGMCHVLLGAPSPPPTPHQSFHIWCAYVTRDAGPTLERNAPIAPLRFCRNT